MAVPSPVPVPGSSAKPPIPAGAAPRPAGAPPLPEGSVEPVMEEEAPAVKLGFFQLPWVQNVLPFVTSLTLHAALIVIGFLTYQVIKTIQAEPPQDQIIIPDSTLADAGPPGGVPNVGLGDDAMKQAAQDNDAEHATDSGAFDKKGQSVDLAQAGGGSGDASDQIIGVGPGGGFGKGKGVGSGANDGHGSGDGEGGALARFGTPGGGGIGPKGPVFGHGGNARLISFVCDASGSMINKMASLKSQLSNAIQGLRATQGFGVIFFQDEKFTTLNAALLPATPENKRKASQFLDDITTTGQTNPLPGLELAFKQHPQLIYLLTDGDFPDNAGVLKKIRELEKGSKIKINTIAFATASDTDTDFISLLKKISDESGGVFKKVDPDSLDNN